MDLRLLIVLAMVALPIGLLVWARRRRGPSMDLATARAGMEKVMAGAPLTDELITAVAVHTAHNSYRTEGVIDQVIGPDRYAGRLADGTPVRATLSKGMWQRRAKFSPGDRVLLLAVRHSDHALIIGAFRR